MVLRKRYLVLLQGLAGAVCVVQLLAVLPIRRLQVLLRYPDALQLAWYAAILVLLASFVVGAGLGLWQLGRRQFGQAIQWLLVGLAGLGVAFFFWTATFFFLAGYLGDPGPAEAARQEAREQKAADSLRRRAPSGPRP